MSVIEIQQPVYSVTVIDDTPQINVTVQTQAVTVATGLVSFPIPGGGGARYWHYQSTPATTWIINHNLGFRPVIQLRTLGDLVFNGDIFHVSSNTAQIQLVFPMAGYAECV